MEIKWLISKEIKRLLQNEILQAVVIFLKRFFSELLSAPQIIWEWAGQKTLYRVLVLLAAVACVVILIACLYSTILTLFKKGRFSLFSFLFVLILMCAGLWVARGQILSHQLPEAGVIQINGEDAVVYEQYSLARSRDDAVKTSYLTPTWCFADDSFTFKLNDRTILQLTDLNAFNSEKKYCIDSLVHDGKLTYLTAQAQIVSEGVETLCPFLGLYFLPNRQLSSEKWYLEAGETVTADTFFYSDRRVEQLECIILENSGEQVLFLVKENEWRGPRLCLARQMGEDLLIGVSYGFTNRNDGTGNFEHILLDPVNDPDMREYLQQPLTALFDGRIRLLKDLSAEQEAAVLPNRITEYPVGFSLRQNGFSIPCSELIAMSYEELPYDARYYAPALRFRGAGPDGEECLYTLFNGGEMHDSEAVGYILPPERAWDSVYHDNQSEVDTAMSEFIGMEAVPYQDGWLLKMGSLDSNGNDIQYYYLSMEPLKG